MNTPLVMEPTAFDGYYKQNNDPPPPLIEAEHNDEFPVINKIIKVVITKVILVTVARTT